MPNLLTPNDVLVCNNTKVFKARIPLNQTKIKRKSWEIRNVDGEIFVYQLNHDGRLECLVSDDKNFKPWAEVFLDEEKWISLTSDEYSEDLCEKFYKCISSHDVDLVSCNYNTIDHIHTSKIEFVIPFENKQESSYAVIATGDNLLAFDNVYVYQQHYDNIPYVKSDTISM